MRFSTIVTAGLVVLGIAFSAESALAQTPAVAFPDVASTNPHYQAIMYLKGKGIVGGYPDGTFHPDQVVNRAEAVKIIWEGHCSAVDASGGVPAGCGGESSPSVLSGFHDLDMNAWYIGDLGMSVMNHVIQGYPDGTFRPAQTVNLVESLKMLLAADMTDLSSVQLNGNAYADTDATTWYGKFVQFAKDKNLIDADAANMVHPTQGMTRGTLAEEMYRLLYINENHLTTFVAPGLTITPPPTATDLIDLSTIKVGDMVGTWKVAALTDISGTGAPQSGNTVVKFTGDATVSGKFIYYGDDQMGGPRVCMYDLDDASSMILPKFKDADVKSVFCFTDEKKAAAAFDIVKGTQGTAQVKISNYQAFSFDGEANDLADLDTVVSKTVTVAPQVVNIQNFAFAPATITVKAGTPVTWTNKDAVDHSVVLTSPKNEDSSSDHIKPGDSFTTTLSEVGTYNYICGIHPSMKGTVVVTQ